MKRVIKYMKVVLIKDVSNLGRTGEIKDVRSGFARNFLIPQKFAIYLDDPKAQELLRKKLSTQKEISKEGEKALAKIKSISGEKIVFRVKINKKGKPFKAIHAKDIAKKLAIDVKQVLTKPIAEIGRQEVLIKKGDLETKVLVEILAEK